MTLQNKTIFKLNHACVIVLLFFKYIYYSFIIKLQKWIKSDLKMEKMSSKMFQSESQQGLFSFSSFRSMC